jgi:hypothetical protein
MGGCRIHSALDTGVWLDPSRPWSSELYVCLSLVCVVLQYLFFLVIHAIRTQLASSGFRMASSSSSDGRPLDSSSSCSASSSSYPMLTSQSAAASSAASSSSLPLLDNHVSPAELALRLLEEEEEVGGPLTQTHCPVPHMFLCLPAVGLWLTFRGVLFSSFATFTAVCVCVSSGGDAGLEEEQEQEEERTEGQG